MFDWTVDMRRTGAALAVIALHVLILALFLRGTFYAARIAAPAREITVRLLPLPPPKLPEKVRPAPPIRVIVPLPHAQAPIATPQAPGGSIEGLHQYLFGCAPEDLDKLTPEQRAQCPMTFNPGANAPDNVLNLPSRAHDAPHWQRALARKQNPLLLPCANAAGLPLTPQAVLCVVNGAINGFGDLDEAPGYGDPPPVQVRVPNNGDPWPEPPHH